MRPSTIISGLLVLVGLTVTSAHYLDDDIYARDIDNIYARDIDADYLKGIYARGFEDGMTEAGLKKRKQPKLIPMACNSCGHHADDVSRIFFTDGFWRE